MTSMRSLTNNCQTTLTQLKTALAEGRLSAGAEANIRTWLTESRYADYAGEVIQHVEQGKWQELDDVFWTVIPFGTGGRRGKMYPIGSNAINDRTIGESAQGLADYVKSESPDGERLACAIAYDTRHRSEHFARLCAEIMAAAGFSIYFFHDHRSTPELSFAVRFKKCACGIMVTASHNPPSDNAVKVYWSTGGQILPPHDAGVIDQVMNVDEIHRRPYTEALSAGQIVLCQEEVDAAFVQAVHAQSVSGPRSLKILYSPLHGVGTTAVCPVLKEDQFSDVEIFAPHAEPSGDFPNVPGHVSNPENPAVFDAIISRAIEVGADLVLASDPDCDRIGCAAPLTPDSNANWETISGNQLGALLADFVLNARRQAGRLTPEHYVVKTLVTTDLVRRIADHYGVKTYGNLLVGFKWIGGMIDELGPEKFVYAAEESHGYMIGTHVRDKDGAVAAMLLAELAAQLKERGQTLHQKLASLFRQYGTHAEKTISVAMPGSEGMQRIGKLMARLREKPPRALAGIEVAQIRDYLQQTVTPVGGHPQPLDGPHGDLIMLDLAQQGNYVAVRPSGTEAKVKFYGFVYQTPDPIADLDAAKQVLSARLASFEEELTALAEA